MVIGVWRYSRVCRSMTSSATSSVTAKTTIAWINAAPPVGMGDPVPTEPLGSVTVRGTEGDITMSTSYRTDPAVSAV